MESDDLLGYYVQHKPEVDTAQNSLYLFVLDYLEAWGPLPSERLATDIGIDRNEAALILNDFLSAGFVSGRDRSDNWAISRRGKHLLDNVLGPNRREAVEKPGGSLNSRDISATVWERARQALVFYFSRRHGLSGAEDLAQETLMAVWNREDFRFEKEEDFLRVCYGFAARVMRTSYRQARRLDDTQPDPDTIVREQSEGVLNTAEMKVFLDEVALAGKKGLSEREWELIQQAAASEGGRLPTGSLGLDEKTARIVLHRARKKLARLVGWQNRRKQT